MVVETVSKEIGSDLTFMLDIRRELAERLSARAIREGKNLEAVMIEVLGKGM